MERIYSDRVHVREIEPDYWRFERADGSIVRLPVRPHFQGVCLAAGFIGSGGQNVEIDDPEKAAEAMKDLIRAFPLEDRFKLAALFIEAWDRFGYRSFTVERA